jgi:hypothetical protein
MTQERRERLVKVFRFLALFFFVGALLIGTFYGLEKLFPPKAITISGSMKEFSFDGLTSFDIYIDRGDMIRFKKDGRDHVVLFDKPTVVVVKMK